MYGHIWHQQFTFFLSFTFANNIFIDESTMILKHNLQPHYEVIAEFLLAKSGKLDGDGLLLEKG